MTNSKKITPIIIENWNIQPHKDSISETIKEAREEMIFDTCQKMFESGYFNSSIIVGDENLQKRTEKFNFVHGRAYYSQSVHDDLLALGQKREGK